MKIYKEIKTYSAIKMTMGGWIVFLSIYIITLPLFLPYNKNEIIYQVGISIFYLQLIVAHVLWCIGIIKGFNGLRLKKEYITNLIAILLSSFIPLFLVIMLSLGITA